MNRNEVLAASAIAVLAALGAGQIYLDRGAQRASGPKQAEVIASPESVAETRPVTIDQVVAAAMPGLEQGEREQRLEVLSAVLDELESEAYGKTPLPKASAEGFVKAAVDLVTVSTEAETAELAATRRRVTGFVASRTRTPQSKEFVLTQLETGADGDVASVVKLLGRPGGVGGKDVYEAVLKLGAEGKVAGEVLPGALRRLGGKKAVEPIVELMKNSGDWRTINACIIALQEYSDLALLGQGFERLEQLGQLTKAERQPWVSPKLFGEFMQKAEGQDLKRGLRFAKARPSLMKSSVAAAERGLGHSDPEIRLAAAGAVRKAVIAGAIETAQGESLLTGRLTQETEPVLKAELTGGLEQLRGFIPKPRTTQQ